MYPIEAGYNTAEFQACGSLNLGVGHCFIDPQTDLQELKFAVQGYYLGKVSFNGCGLNEAKTYAQNELVAPNSSIRIQKDCVISFTVSPELPKEEESGIKIGSLRGQLYLILRKSEGKQYFNASQVRMDEVFGPTFDVFLDGETEWKVKFTSSGIECALKDGQQDYNSTDGWAHIPITDFLSLATQKQCFLKGLFSTPSDDAELTWVIGVYFKSFTPLPVPSAVWKGNKLCVVADENVSVLSLDSSFHVERDKCFRSDPNTDHILRALTVGGRLVIGLWSGQKGEWRWLK